MKIGDKVRFLNEVGGGKITAFRPGGIVLVEDADGFEVPVHQDEVVVIEEEKATGRRTEFGNERREERRCHHEFPNRQLRYEEGNEKALQA